MYCRFGSVVWTAAAAMALSVSTAFGGVWDEATFDLQRGGADLDGDGLATGGEFKDALHRGDASYTLDGGTLYGNPTAAVFRNETVVCPYACASNVEQALYFRQPVAWTDAGSTTGEIWPNSFCLPNLLSGLTNGYSICIRFRTDADLPLNTLQFLLNFGYASGKGLMVGLSGTNTASRALLLYGAGDWIGSAGFTTISNNVWTDLALTVSGEKINLLLMQEGGQVLSATVDKPGKDFTPGPDLIVGAQTVAGNAPQAYAREIMTDTGWQQNAAKAFCGSLSRLGIWDRPLTETELRRAMGDPRPELFRIGAENGNAHEFVAARPPASFDARHGDWSALPPGLAAGETLALSFVLDDPNCIYLPQVFRWKTTDETGTGTLTLNVNGIDLRTVDVREPGKLFAYIPQGHIQGGTNVIRITRSDAGPGRITLDAMKLGGSWQIGAPDALFSEFGLEGRCPMDYYATDGNQGHVRRVINRSSATNLILHLEMPSDLVEDYVWTYDTAFSFVSEQDNRYAVAFNDAVLAQGTPPPDRFAKPVELKLPRNEFQGTGDETINWMNTAEAKPLAYYSLDYHRLKLSPRMKSCVLIFRGTDREKDLVTWPAAQGCATTADFAVRVDGIPIDVCGTPKPQKKDPNDLDDPIMRWQMDDQYAHPYSYAVFDAAREVQIEVTSTQNMANVRILPTSRGIVPDRVTEHAVTFRARPPFQLSVEPNGRHHALILAANLPDRDVPARNDPRVKWLGPGRHRGAFMLGSNETLYLEPGAYLEGRVYGKGTNITVRGRGVISGAPWRHKDPTMPYQNFPSLLTLSGTNLVIRDIVLQSSCGFTLDMLSCEHLLIDNVKVFNGRFPNDDGMDICSCNDVTVRNSFIRSADDIVAVKDHGHDHFYTNCVFWCDMSGIRIGYEDAGPEVGYERLTFKDIDYLHASVEKTGNLGGKSPTSGEPSGDACIRIDRTNESEAKDLVFDNFRFDAIEPGDTFFMATCWEKHGVYSNPNISYDDPAPGSLKNCTLRNIILPPDLPEKTMRILLWGIDEQHGIDGVTFENVVNYGEVIQIGSVTNVVFR